MRSAPVRARASAFSSLSWRLPPARRPLCGPRSTARGCPAPRGGRPRAQRGHRPSPSARPSTGRASRRVDPARGSHDTGATSRSVDALGPHLAIRPRPASTSPTAGSSPATSCASASVATPRLHARAGRRRGVARSLGRELRCPVVAAGDAPFRDASPDFTGRLARSPDGGRGDGFRAPRGERGGRRRLRRAPDPRTLNPAEFVLVRSAWTRCRRRSTSSSSRCRSARDPPALERPGGP